MLVADWGVRPGLPIYQPGRLDGGTAANTVARLTRDAMRANLDAAVATLDADRQLINDQFDLGPVTGVGMAELGMEVVKSGRRTNLTYGRVIDVEATARLGYGPISKIIRHVFSIEPRNSFEQASGTGDSGSLWLDRATMRAVGLHFAGSEQPERGLAMDLQSVLDALDVDLATEQPSDRARQIAQPQALRRFGMAANAPADRNLAAEVLA